MASAMRTLMLLIIGVTCGINLVYASPLPGKKIDITGQRSISVREGESITLELSDLTVVADPETGYPSGFYIEIDNGEQYTVAGQTITPNPEFRGTLKVKLRVTDGKVKSEKFNFKIEVKANADPPGNGSGGGGGGGNGSGGNDDGGTDITNEKPVVSGQLVVVITKNSSFKIELTDLTVTDPTTSTLLTLL
jgi:hypothetical protein